MPRLAVAFVRYSAGRGRTAHGRMGYRHIRYKRITGSRTPPKVSETRRIHGTPAK